MRFIIFNVINIDSIHLFDPIHPALIIPFLTDKPSTLNFKELYLDFKKVNHNEINNYLNFLNLCSKLSGYNINRATNHFYDIIYEVINKNVPTYTYYPLNK